jgi:rubredoxin
MPPLEHLPARTDRRLDPAAKLECGVCWYVYDPARGDPVWRIEPGTPFSDLPAHWSCPNCAAERAQFLPLDAGAAAGGNE